MGSSSSQSTSGAFSGNNGVRLYSSEHSDIDESTIDVSCRAGSCRVTLEEAIWYSWVTRRDVNLAAGGRLNETIEVDSDWYDGDHKLIVVATSDNTSVDVTWESTDR
jgi:hypothetical protein